MSNQSTAVQVAEKSDMTYTNTQEDVQARYAVNLPSGTYFLKIPFIVCQQYKPGVGTYTVALLHPATAIGHTYGQANAPGLPPMPCEVVGRIQNPALAAFGVKPAEDVAEAPGGLRVILNMKGSQYASLNGKALPVAEIVGGRVSVRLTPDVYEPAAQAYGGQIILDAYFKAGEVVEFVGAVRFGL